MFWKKMTALFCTLSLTTALFGTTAFADDIHVTYITPKGVIMKTAPAGSDMTYEGPTDINMEGYAFCGWDVPLACVESDIIANAVYMPMGLGTETHDICTVYQNLPTGVLSYTHVNPQTIPETTMNLTNPATPMSEPCTLTALETIELNPVGISGQTCVVKWFNGSTGELWKADVVAYGSSLPQPENPCIDGLDFTGWDGSWTDITEDRNIIAGFYKNYRVLYLCEVCEEPMKDVVIRVGDDIPEFRGPFHAHSDHIYKGWYERWALQPDGYTIVVLSDYTDVDKKEKYLGDGHSELLKDYYSGCVIR